MRAMPLAFPANPLVRRYETQFMCGEALLVAPIVQEGGEVEIALPPGGWFDLNSRDALSRDGRCCATKRRSTSSRCSVAKVTRCRWARLSSTPARSPPRSRSSRCGCSASRRRRSTRSQARIHVDDDGKPVIRVADGVQVHFFGDALPVEAL